MHGKKYPIIFSIYENMSDGLYKFPAPELISAKLSIPYFVSHDYLVFCPDIRPVPGDIGPSSYNDVISAVNALIRKPWVDKSKIGIHGHSFGAYETNFILTKTKVFAAAASSAGTSNIISASGSLMGFAHDSHDYYSKINPECLRAFGKIPQHILKNSPIFNADKVCTPLLMMHNMQDHSVPWTQAIEYYTALRYLNKKVWLLQYDNGGHTLINEQDQADCTLRLMQYFNHYLRGMPAPRSG